MYLIEVFKQSQTQRKCERIFSPFKNMSFKFQVLFQEANATLVFFSIICNIIFRGRRMRSEVAAAAAGSSNSSSSSSAEAPTARGPVATSSDITSTSSQQPAASSQQQRQ